MVRIQRSLLGLLSQRCLLKFPVEIPRKQLGTIAWSSRKKLGLEIEIWPREGPWGARWRRRRWGPACESGTRRGDRGRTLCAAGPDIQWLDPGIHRGTAAEERLGSKWERGSGGGDAGPGVVTAGLRWEHRGARSWQSESRRVDPGRSGIGEYSRERSSGSGFDSPLCAEETPQRGRPRGPERETSRGLGTAGVCLLFKDMSFGHLSLFLVNKWHFVPGSPLSDQYYSSNGS